MIWFVTKAILFKSRAGWHSRGTTKTSLFFSLLSALCPPAQSPIVKRGVCLQICWYSRWYSFILVIEFFMLFCFKRCDNSATGNHDVPHTTNSSSVSYINLYCSWVIKQYIRCNRQYSRCKVNCCPTLKNKASVFVICNCSSWDAKIFDRILTINQLSIVPNFLWVLFCSALASSGNQTRQTHLLLRPTPCSRRSLNIPPIVHHRRFVSQSNKFIIILFAKSAAFARITCRKQKYSYLQWTIIGPDSFFMVDPTTARTRRLNSNTAFPKGQVCECHSV